MDIPPEVLEVLKCSSCELYLSRGPVFLQHDGVAACGRCYTPKRPATRNTQYEATARLLKFPCKYQEFGCRVTVPYAGQEEGVVHEEVCEHRRYVCPVLGSDYCNWLGTRAAMLAHCRDQHPDSVLENPCSLTHDITRASLRNYVMIAFQVIFLLHTKICVVSGKLLHAVRLLGTSVEAAEYFFHLDIKRGDEQVTKKGQVASQSCLAIQEDTSLALDTNSLLSVLGGFDGARFTVTVKRSVTEKCVVCAEEVTVFLYRDEYGWRCERCAPARRACKNEPQGCTHTDINKKCLKHEHYFCQQRTQCYICDVSLSRGSLSAHYGSVHQSITHRAGAAWRVTQDEMQYCLVSSVAGTAVCSYWLLDSQFGLSVRTPLSSEQLREFRCEVRLTDSATGHPRTFTPDTKYDDWSDWDIVIDKNDFSSLDTEFDVCLEINKAKSS